ncbi:hypothetical protein [Streptomyces sp. NPDC003480]
MRVTATADHRRGPAFRLNTDGARNAARNGPAYGRIPSRTPWNDPVPNSDPELRHPFG